MQQNKTEELIEAKKKILELEQELEQKSQNFEKIILEKNHHKKQMEYFENEIKKIASINKSYENALASEKNSAEQKIFELKNQVLSIEKYLYRIALLSSSIFSSIILIDKVIG